MLKWLILGFFAGGLLIGSVVSANAKARGGCTLTSGGNDDVENGNDNADGSDNGSADNGNSNSAANENANGGTNSNANENTNANGAANGNENSANANANVNGAGNANANDNGTDSGVTINARFEGTLTGTSVESLDGAPQTPRDRRLLPSVQFEGAFTPVLLHVLHYADSTSSGSGTPATVEAENLTNVLLGQTQTFNYDDGFPVTLGVNVSEATYGARSFRVVLTMTFNSVEGNLTRTGTGRQVMEGALDGSDNLVLTIDAEYEVDLVAGSFSFATTETITLTGTLPRQ